MRAISLFSGAGGFEIGFDRAGIQTVLQAESDPWCLSVLARHWPDVERVTDVRSVDSRFAGAPRWFGDRRRHGKGSSTDLVYGGFPCQDVSVAGKRAGLSGERSGLWHEFERVLRELRPRWFAAENVPGLLSSPTDAPGVDFGIVLRTMVELGYGVAWRILDGRWFGVPQRRRRVFVVGCLGDARRAAQVLAVCESCGGHPAPRRETGEDLAPTLDDGARRASVDLPMIAASLSGGGHPGSNMPGRHKEDDVNLVTVALAPGAHPGGVTGRDAENGALLVANGLRASDGHHGHSSPRGDGADNLVIPHSPMGVRRLTPLECERLMAWPDGHTKYTADGHEIPDSHRYRMCGNGVVATVAEWLGHRLVQADVFMERAA